MNKSCHVVATVVCVFVVFLAAWRVAFAALDEIGFRLVSEHTGPHVVRVVVTILAPLVAASVVAPLAIGVF